MNRCDKCGSELCEFCGKACGGGCDKARIAALEEKVRELDARPVVYPVPIVQPLPHPTIPNPYVHPPFIAWYSDNTGTPPPEPPYRVSCNAQAGCSPGNGFQSNA